MPFHVGPALHFAYFIILQCVRMSIGDGGRRLIKNLKKGVNSDDLAVRDFDQSVSCGHQRLPSHIVSDRLTSAIYVCKYYAVIKSLSYT